MSLYPSCNDECGGCAECCSNATTTDKLDAAYCGSDGEGCAYCSRPDHYQIRDASADLTAESGTVARKPYGPIVAGAA